MGDTGGASSVTLSTAQLPAHNHGLNNHTHSFRGTTSNVNLSHSHSLPDYAGGSQAQNAGIPTGNAQQATNYNTGSALGNHNHTVSGTTGGNSGTTTNAGSGNSHENRPPFYALCYIMKT